MTCKDCKKNILVNLRTNLLHMTKTATVGRTGATISSQFTKTVLSLKTA